MFLLVVLYGLVSIAAAAPVHPDTEMIDPLTTGYAANYNNRVDGSSKSAAYAIPVLTETIISSVPRYMGYGNSMGSRHGMGGVYGSGVRYGHGYGHGHRHGYNHVQGIYPHGHRGYMLGR